jgi:hypothetical protein
MLISKTHEQLKSIEGLFIKTNLNKTCFSLSFSDEFEERNSKQQSIINDLQKMIQVFKDEQNKTKIFYEKQFATLNDQCLREKDEIKTVCKTLKF